MLVSACESASGCPTAYEHQTVELTAKVSSQLTLGLARYTTLEDGAHQTCLIVSTRLVGENGATVHLTNLIAFSPHNQNSPRLMFRDEYDKLPALNQ